MRLMLYMKENGWNAKFIEIFKRSTSVCKSTYVTTEDCHAHKL